jgi:hypothetical protein
VQHPKYAVEAYSSTSAGEPIWALCRDASDDMFADRRPPARTRYELLGCTPEGEAATAVDRARAEGSAPLGDLNLRPLGGPQDRPENAWRLEHVRILGAHPRLPDAPGLLDVTVEAAELPAGPPEPPGPARGFLLVGSDGEARGRCEDWAAVPQDVFVPAEPPVRLLGCSPRGALRDALEAGEEELGHARVSRLDRMGWTIATVLEAEITAWIPSAHGRGLVDLTLDPWSQRLPRAAREVWDLWWCGRPTDPNAWARCSPQGRELWLNRAREEDLRSAWDPHTAPGATYHLDGRHITDGAAFYCALGEAVNGPGGYYGHDRDTVDDYLTGGFGAEPPFTLVWHDAEVARTCLGVTPHRNGRPPTFEELLAFLAEERIDVRMA